MANVRYTRSPQLEPGAPHPLKKNGGFVHLLFIHLFWRQTKQCFGLECVTEKANCHVSRQNKEVASFRENMQRLRALVESKPPSFHGQK